MKKKKLTLEALKIESFVTSIGLQEAKQFYGGSMYDASWDCWGNPGNFPDPYNTNYAYGSPCDPLQTTVKCNTTSDCGNPTDPGNSGGTTPPSNPPSNGGGSTNTCGTISQCISMDVSCYG